MATIQPDSYDPLFPIRSSSSSSSRAAPAADDDNDKLKAFIAGFYAASDDPGRNDDWLSYFAPDAVLIMGDKVVRGTEGIREFRRGMWENVRSRKHRPTKVFPASFPSPSSSPETGTGAGTAKTAAVEYMLHGSLDLELKSGDISTVAWAGRAVLEEVPGGGGALKYALYQVYMHR
ncbi:hypothetical protein SLS62_003808 [Diatrype stigma]|uniref:SnoaL-like domain-containing protein n=1 Tax=Diatrype stigma TaxID=117547 RepID=A0AAN9UVG9_9PEZI